jgi:heme/copper-type cytochrome/quinol oxidase subunit 2
MISCSSAIWKRRLSLLMGGVLLGATGGVLSVMSAPVSCRAIHCSMVDAAETLPRLPDPFAIEITGNNNRWYVRYPGRGARPLLDLHAPQGAKIVLILKSTDYVYTLAFPELGLKEIAVPGREFRLALGSANAGRFDLVGDQLCGDAHPELQGQMVVEPAERFLKWLNREAVQIPTAGPR